MSTRRIFRIAAAGLRSPAAMLCLVAALGCRGDAGRQAKVFDQTTAERLVGAWDVTLRLERPLSLTVDAQKLPLSVVGVVAILEDRDGRLSFDQMNDPTHIGVYEIALGSFGLPPREADVIPSLAARTLPGPASATSAAHDSVYIVINPETPRHALRLAGTFDGDSVRGVWVAESFLGGGGTFVLKRRIHK